MELDIDRQKVRDTREALGLSLADAAELAGMKSRQQWQRIEKNPDVGITVKMLGTLARVLKLDPCALLVKPPAKRTRRTK